MRFRVLIAGALVGCAHAPAPAPKQGEVQDLRRQLAESQSREADLQRKVDELTNRLFILSDQLDARDVQMQKKVTPRLPVDARADAPDSGGDVEYAGEARDAHAPRPVLRLVGSQPPSRSGSEVAGEMTPVAPPPRRSGTPIRNEWHPPPDDGDRLPVTRAVPAIPKSDGAIKSAPAPVKSAPAQVASAPRANDSVDAMKLYNASVDLLKHGQHAEAIAGLQKFIHAYPTHDYADNAQYWLGECYYDQKDYKSALREFRRVVQRYPSGNKVPDALLKVGYCYWQLSDTGKARDVLEQVVKSYPGSDIAKKAADKLSELK